jgi:hypothetical protein
LSNSEKEEIIAINKARIGRIEKIVKKLNDAA